MNLRSNSNKNKTQKDKHDCDLFFLSSLPQMKPVITCEGAGPVDNASLGKIRPAVIILPLPDTPALPVPANSADPPSKHPTLGIPAATLKALRARPCDAFGVEVLLRSAIGEEKRRREERRRSRM